MPGYPQLFKINDPVNGDPCDQISWTAYCNDVVDLVGRDRRARYAWYNVTTKLRQDVNDVILYVNNLIATVVSQHAATDLRILYMDVDGAFESRRFRQIPEGGSITTG